MSQPGASDVAIVGAGISGLAIAHELLRRRPDLDVAVLEKSERPGGLLHTAPKDGYLLETAANAFLDGPGTAVELARDLGVEMVTASPAAKRRYVYRHGKLRQVPTSPPALLKSDLLSLRGRLRLLAEPLVARADREETVAEWGRRRLGSEVTDAIVAPFLVGVFAGDAEKLSMTAALPRLAELEAQHGSLLRGMLASRKAGKGAPKLWSPRRGVQALVDALAAKVGRHIQTGVEVTALGDLAAKKIVVALPPRAAQKLVATPLLEGRPAVNVVVVHVGLAPSDLAHPLDGFGFLVAKGEDVRCLGCVFESSTWPDRAPEGRALLRLIYGGDRDPEFLSLTDDQIADAVSDDLEKTLGLRRAAVPLSIVRWPQAIPQYHLGHQAWVAEVEAAAREAGVILAGNAYHGVSVNDCVKDAQRVADLVLAPSP